MNELRIKENKILELTGENKLLKEKVKKYKREIEKRVKLHILKMI